MDEKFRLVFRGELLEGQHKAVVKRRLAERLKLDEEQIEKLFSGDSVVVKRDADRETAARYQSAFKQAGGLLRIQVVDPEPPERAAVPDKAVNGPRSVNPPATRQTLAGAALKAIRPAANPEISAPDFTVQATYFPPPAEPAPDIQAPAYVLAERGTFMKVPADSPAPRVVEVNFELAAAGADLLEHPRAVQVVALGPLDFELAEVGADLGPATRTPPPAAPDVSHLALLDA